MIHEDDELAEEEELKDRRARGRYIKKKARIIINDLGTLAPPVILNDVKELLSSQYGIKFYIKPMILNDHLSGVYVREENTVGIIYNSKHSKNRRRFTIGHEFGHLVLEHNLRINRHEEKINFETKKPIEREANIFGAELLMPKSLLKKYLATNFVNSVINLASAFQVSKEAMWFKIVSDKLDKHISI